MEDLTRPRGYKGVEKMERTKGVSKDVEEVRGANVKSRCPGKEVKQEHFVAREHKHDEPWSVYF